MQPCVLIVGCREEPTIVIKFEPNDLARTPAVAKPADMVATVAAVHSADLGVVDKGPDKKSKRAALECKVAADCVIEPEECCDCANGGKQHAIAKKKAVAAKARATEKCKTKMCTMMLSTDPSCEQRADCVDGACVMVKKIAAGYGAEAVIDCEMTKRSVSGRPSRMTSTENLLVTRSQA